MNKIKISLCCPKPRMDFAKDKGEHINDELVILKDYLSKARGDIVVFPEGFLADKNIENAIDIIKKSNKWVIAGGQDTGENETLYTLVISPQDGIVHKHIKTSLTEDDRMHKAIQGEDIKAIDTPFARIGIVLCYEMHFPEVARIEGIEGAQILFNTIGTGMWHKQQLDEWTTLAKARAIENRCFVVGCTHYCDPIPLMFAYNPHGKCIALTRNKNGIEEIEIDLKDIDERNYFKDRNPRAYTKIVKEKEYGKISN